MNKDKEYLSDGAYVEIDHYISSQEIILTTSNGIKDTNRIVLDDIAIRILLKFLMSRGFSHLFPTNKS